MKKLIDILPLVIFVILIVVLFSFLSIKNNQLETVLIDDTFPKFSISLALPTATAATTNGPITGPFPASSTPHIMLQVPNGPIYVP